MTETFILAVAGPPFGLKGFVKIRSLSGETGHLASLKTVTLRQKGTEKDYIVEETAFLDDPAVVCFKFSGINNPEEAKKLAGAELIAPRSMAAPLQNNEFYIEDLKGLRIFGSVSVNPETGAGLLGHIVNIVEGGSGELAEIRTNSGQIKLVPFRKEFFTEINIEQNRAILLETWILDT